MSVTEGTPSGIAWWRRAGPGRRLVCLHGIGSHGDSFRALLPELPAEWDVTAWTAPGYDGSAPLAPDWPTEADYAAALRTLLDSLKLDRVTLLGHSLGTLIAASFAAEHPDRVATLVLAATATGHGGPVGQLSDAAAGRLADLDALGAQAFARARAPRLLANPDRHPEATAQVTGNMARIAMPGYGQAVRMLASGQLTANLARVRCPATLLWGTGDIITPRDQSEAAAAALGGASIIDIADSGHAAYVETPRAFAAALTQALDQAETTETAT